MPNPSYPRSAFFQKLGGAHPQVTLVSPSEADDALTDFPETEFTLSGGLTPYTGPWTKAHAAHLLRRATFGIKKEHLDQYTAFSNAAEAVDAILTPPALPDPPVNNYNNPDFTDPFIPLGETWVDAIPLPDHEGYRIESWRGWWLKQAVESGADIREKITLFWYNHFPIQADIVFEGRALYRYNNLLRSHALGNFKELVRLVTIDPAMLYFLNGYLNEVSAPDENFARELQELFTIGKESTDTYTEDDVRAAARVLTGWRVNSMIGASFFDEPSHDKANKQFSSFYNNTVIAGQADGAAELDALLDMIFQKEEIATHICRKIYRFFFYYKIDQTVENEIIAPLAQLFRDHHYDIQPVMRTLLLSEHFFDATNKGCYIKTPLDLTMGLMRNFVMDELYPEPYDEWVIMLYLNYYNNELQMLLGQPPNVAGWPPFRQAPAYHRNWISGATMRNRNVYSDIMALYAYNGNNASIKINHIATAAQCTDPGEPDVLIDELLSILLPMEIPVQKNSHERYSAFRAGRRPLLDGCLERIPCQSERSNGDGNRTVEAYVPAQIHHEPRRISTHLSAPDATRSIMKRRHFLQYAGAAAAWSGFKYKGFALNPISHAPMFKSLAGCTNENNRVLVLIQLTGGNDGLNTLIPMDQYDQLATVRQNILIPESKVLSLDGTSLNAVHPAFSDVKNLYNEGKVSIVQNVGYPNQDYSHFRSTDIWMSGSDADAYLGTGWAGRYLQNLNPDFPDGYPNPDHPDPLAVQIGSVVSLALMGNRLPMGVAISDPQSYYQFVNDQTEPTPNTPYGQELSFLRLVSQQAQTYYDSIKNAANAGHNLSTLYPVLGENNLADQLRIVAQLISGGLRTPIYVVSLDGFDTHSEQVSAAEGTIYGKHADLLRKVSVAIGAFQDDLQLLDLEERVAGMTFSEFGRTIASNGSIGTDHGAGAPMFVFGKNEIPGIIGNNPMIPEEVGPSEDIPMVHDFRSVYASALKDWFGLDDPETALGHDYPILPIFKAPMVGIEQPVRSKVAIQNDPNPFVEETTFTFSSDGGAVLIQITDIHGKVRHTVLEGNYPAGKHAVTYRKKDLPAGTYFYSIRVNGAVISKKLLVI